MKICLINNLYKPYNRGGAERIVELVVDGLQEAGYEVFLITTKPITQKHKNTKTQKHRIYYIDTLYYNLNRMPKILRLFWHLCDMFDIGSYFKVKAILKKEKPDVVMTHNLKGVGYLIPNVIKNLGIKHIHTLHDIQLLHPSGLMIYGKEKQIDGILAKMYASICRWLFGSPDVVVSPSKWLMDMHTNRGFFKDSMQAVISNPTFLITSPPTPAASPPLLSKERGVGGEVKSESFRFFYVGQIEAHKGVLFLIKVFKILREELEDESCELIIAGDGSKLKQAQKLAGDDGGVKFLGRVDNKDLLIMMQKYNALIAPSLCYENSPTVIYEALAAGLPVIASRIGGITELAHKTAGILFKPDNGGDLMYQMKWAIEHKKRLQKIGEIGKEKIKQFGVENYIRKIESLIK